MSSPKPRPGAVLALLAVFSLVATTGSSHGDSGFIGWTTNGPAVYRLRFLSVQTLPGPAVSWWLPPTNLPPEIRVGMIQFRAAANLTLITNTERVFDHFLPESLNQVVWTNVAARTNGRSMVIWSERRHPPGWPGKPPVVRWNPDSLIWGMKGMTALSPCWEGEGGPGQVPITALTRRHGYTRGHGMGPDRVGSQYAGLKVWFLTDQNRIVEVKVKREIVRTIEVSGRDYTILLFNKDLPATIQPMSVTNPNELFGVGPLFETEQTGGVSAGLPGFSLNTMKGGDSGSPNMLPLPGELVFVSGRTTSSASPEMQADMDQLCRLEGLDPARYQLDWADLSKYPKYPSY